jgi:RimJ/RimL family protein N-acetyltransferase
MPSPIETARLILHPWRVTELDEYARLLADPDAMRHITHEYGPLSREEAEQAHSRILRLWAERGFGAFAAVEKATGSWAGKIGLDYLDRWPGSDKIEVEWQLVPAFWSRGYATEGLGTSFAGRSTTWASNASSRLPCPTIPRRAASWRNAG